MMNIAGLGRLAAATVVLSGLAFGSAVKAQEVSEDQLKASRAAIDAIGATAQFDNILPGLAERLKAGLIQDSPNYQDIISSTVDAQALALAPRRGDLEKEAALTYAKTFTAAELKAIADFYNSDVGKKLLRDGPVASRETAKAADIWAQGISRDLEKQSNTELSKVIKAPPPATESPAAPAAAPAPAPATQQ
ncbi:MULTISPECIES: DUF2059 domain-containing protein [unclassified Rhizobium]|uniref:DUF2059 domain-containing protein n=1 Tax=unclassified Rhizobium TaxID=2613769 RepID=UPI001A9823D9|nr:MULTISPECIES: DUF2059 domain-containing protein [unclassified Rhizobium]MBX5167153.1 DUF2059 domain-containing protein [Rhizobium sp. NZLR4b]MBX5172965.1 DUF2059 domain-containing protein [Rhizobium sp. NZLR1b]MBX5185467.1 DUF2059 domain-containing protein [Rhizobium sp. NZLR5]MBX5190772.1 DUF2059 domain-containing protein [Rhizobium sp. NZLR3b]MBX5199658.1 DUF2059 domain-containing protein [Rhizobium sp. NZLR10]